MVKVAWLSSTSPALLGVGRAGNIQIEHKCVSSGWAAKQHGSFVVASSKDRQEEKNLSRKKSGAKEQAPVQIGGPGKPGTADAWIQKRIEQDLLEATPIGVDEQGEPIYRRRQQGYVIIPPGYWESGRLGMGCVEEGPSGEGSSNEEDASSGAEPLKEAGPPEQDPDLPIKNSKPESQAPAQHDGSDQAGSGASAPVKVDRGKKRREDARARIEKRLEQDRLEATPIGINEQGRPIYRRRHVGYAANIPGDDYWNSGRRCVLDEEGKVSGEGSSDLEDARSEAEQSNEADPLEKASE
ncbi:hypothetical protein KFL_001900150 [Klebsormidium nitens]|uniref:Uncharacterized protein n=1 Tax=Klebsormidium nitens TaxID=105231 RepID=A0A1Y1I3D9_KLENI|nr:hypothetical protein KFL_001900150 [Klebsormidium nitens]|eukprot:GAQ84472.1 hypothetical protein KFL_001900150 [Klebsormidium nitens]